MRNDFAIHIVDDDPGVRESMKTLIRGSKYPTYSYPSASAFLDRCESATGCVLIDLRLRDMDGIALQKELISRQIALDVVMMSAYGDIEHAVEAMRLGAVDFLEKPFDPDYLLAQLHELSQASDTNERLQREARQRAALIDTLTPREKQVLSGIVDGQANKQVAADLRISARTVETHRVHIMQKLQADSLAHLVRIWLAAAAQQEPTPEP
ncbi:response regulator transcription factor [Salinisphaera sp.]|uniref:response regulator transcription factor n=1 Tax=Salinisphaera sp. TaxID=1914330 RepID=UPI002D797312|nr:response regulator [Salinisphaera sp.]HET7315382.1 response regulator [Salinisphaera sp.]